MTGFRLTMFLTRLIDTSAIICILFASFSPSVSATEKLVELHKCSGAQRLPPEIRIPNRLVSGGQNQDLVFSIKTKTLNCATNWTSQSISKTSSQKPLIKLSSTGILFLHSEYFYRNEYCISGDNESTLEISVCQVKCGETHICIPKCCGLGKVFNIIESSCVPSGDFQWKPTIYSKDDYKGCGRKVRHLKEHFQYTRSICPEDEQALSYPYKSVPQLELEGVRFRLLEDGTVVANTGQGVWKSQKPFCIDGMVDSSEPFSGELKYQLIMTCSGADEEHESSQTKEWELLTRTIVYTVFIILGIVFLLLTAIIYLLLWDKHNIHGWIVFSFVVCMLFFFVFLATSHIMAELLDSGDYGSTRCTFIAIMVHFFFLCTLCWMSVINVDLWLTFRSLAPSTGRTKMIQRYCIYSSFAMGVPFLIVIFGIILDAIYKGLASGDLECGVIVVTPKYGQEGCRVHPSAEGLYLYLPMGILLGSNILMFSSTVFTLWRYRKTAQNAINSSQSGSQNQSLVLFCKLFIVMGITWVTEIISWSLSDNNNTSDWYIWIFFDIINLLQAVAVFFIFACKRENLVAFYRKFPRGKKLIEPIMRLRCCRVGTMDVEQTEMTSADKHRTNNRVTFTNTRMSSVSQDDY